MAAAMMTAPFAALDLEPADPVAVSDPPAGGDGGWSDLPGRAQLYVALVILGGLAAAVWALPHAHADPLLFTALLVSGALMSAWKVTLPIPVTNGSTLSVADAANVMSLLILGAPAAALIAMAGVLIQCTYRPRVPYPVHRTIFSMAVMAITMLATGWVFARLGGSGVPTAMVAVFAKPFIGAIVAYFLVNTLLVAAAIALSTDRSLIQIWNEDFLWSASSFMVAGATGALAAVIVVQGQQWEAVLLIVPIYLTYRTYQAFIHRLDVEQRHTEQVQRLHEETVTALSQARQAELALAQEKERLARALTEMTHLEHQRQQLLDREHEARSSAESANRLKDQFLAVVSHELRTPLTAILGWADMLCRMPLDDTRRDRAARTIRDSARRQAQLIDDLLDVARISSGKLRLERTRVDLQDVVSDAVQIVQPVAQAKRIRMRVDLRRVDPVHADAARLQQVIWNLLSNAVKFTPENGTIDVHLRQVEKIVEVEVTDSGQGIAPEFLASVFEPFRQADASPTRAHPGLGLGLSIVRSLVEAHHGTVAVSSAGLGGGATFVVRLPAASAVRWDHAPREPRVAPWSDAPDSLAGISVLVVDDDLETRDIVAAHLEEHGAEVTKASSAAEAYDLLQARHVHVLLADIGMPDEDGLSLIRRIRALPAADRAAVPAAALTALARREDRRQALQAGFQMHLAKPVDGRQLVTAVASLHQMNVES
jgi:signal transduction histidine kinase/ActR/RegA family two-component response regulator